RRRNSRRLRACAEGISNRSDDCAALRVEPAHSAKAVVARRKITYPAELNPRTAPGGEVLPTTEGERGRVALPPVCIERCARPPGRRRRLRVTLQSPWSAQPRRVNARQWRVGVCPFYTRRRKPEQM